MRTLLKICMAIMVTTSVAAGAQEEAPVEPPGADKANQDIEINLKALESLRPERENRRADQPVLAPPFGLPGQGLPGHDPAADQDAPPILSAPPDTLLDAPPPDSPTAPRMPTSIAPTKSPKDRPASGMAARETYTVPFEAESAALSLAASDILDQVASAVAGSTMRLQLFGFAGSGEDSPTATRRLALQRTIAVRGYLMNQGILGGRIDLRPQGPQKDDGPTEGVLIKLLGS